MSEEKKLSWTTHETIGDDGRRADAEAMNGTATADNFRGTHGTVPEERYEKVWTCVPMLQFLWGRPWNNMALNYVMGLRPSMIRVTTGETKTDAVTWRVTVYLEEDKRTIREIDQELQTWAIGCRYGADLVLHEDRFKDKLELEQDDFPDFSGGIVNVATVEKLNLQRETNDK